MNTSSSIATVVGRSALLIDLENLAYATGHALIGQRCLGERLDDVLSLAGRVEHRLVAAQRHMLRRYAAELATRNLRWQECPSGPDEADRALTEAGLDLLEHGYGRIVVASGDHYFARFGGLCDLRVAVPSGVPVSARLASASVVLIARPRTAHPTVIQNQHLGSPNVPVLAAA